MSINWLEVLVVVYIAFTVLTTFICLKAWVDNPPRTGMKAVAVVVAVVMIAAMSIVWPLLWGHAIYTHKGRSK